MTPDSVVTTLVLGLNLSTLLSFYKDKTISSKTGTLPPTSPVLPLWGTTANFLSLQYFKIYWILAVVLGIKANFEWPLYFFIQS
jgi:hypothetical protein